MSDKIKCPQCKEYGIKYLYELRWFFMCYACGYKTYLKMLNKKK